jgi:hypothetical protein
LCLPWPCPALRSRGARSPRFPGPRPALRSPGARSPRFPGPRPALRSPGARFPRFPGARTAPRPLAGTGRPRPARRPLLTAPPTPRVVVTRLARCPVPVARPPAPSRVACPGRGPRRVGRLAAAAIRAGAGSAWPTVAARGIAVAAAPARTAARAAGAACGAGRAAVSARTAGAAAGAADRTARNIASGRTGAAATRTTASAGGSRRPGPARVGLAAPAGLAALTAPARPAASAGPGALTAPARLAASARRPAGTRAGGTLPSAGPSRRIAALPPAPVPDHRQLPAKLAMHAITGAYTIKPVGMTVSSHPR